MNQIIIVGAGIAGLTLAITLHSRGLPVKVFESATQIEPLGVGINIQPYATKVLDELGLLDALSCQSVTTREMVFFNKHGQHIYSLPLGRYANHDFPQLSIHRGLLQLELLKAATKRLGRDFLITGHQFVTLSQDHRSVKASFLNTATGADHHVRCDALIGADGVNSKVYQALYPHGPRLSKNGVHMWRGVTVAPKFLTGASMVRVGLPSHGKLVIYPIKNDINPQGDQLINWVAELDSTLPENAACDGIEDPKDFIRFFASRTFDWLDIPGLLDQTSGPIISMSMADRDPLPQWRVGRVTLLGDAAHPMVPVGSNGAGQAILDAYCLGTSFAHTVDVEAALSDYESKRRQCTTNIVLGDRRDLPDRLIEEVEKRSNGAPFLDIHDIIKLDEAHALAVPDYQNSLPRPSNA